MFFSCAITNSHVLGTEWVTYAMVVGKLSEFRLFWDFINFTRSGSLLEKSNTETVHLLCSFVLQLSICLFYENWEQFLNKNLWSVILQNTSFEICKGSEWINYKAWLKFVMIVLHSGAASFSYTYSYREASQISHGRNSYATTTTGTTTSVTNFIGWN